MKKTVSILMVLLLILSTLMGCKKDEDEVSGESKDNASSSTYPVEVDYAKTDADMFTERDKRDDYDESKAITIKLNGTSATASSDSVKISGSTVTITEEATYVVSGELSDGMIVVDAPDTAKLQIVFQEVNITSKTSAALYVLEADKVFLTLAKGTSNSIANGGSFSAIDDSNIDGALFSKQDLTLNGEGNLTVISPAGHGIVCKDDLVITGGNYTFNSASHGLNANDSVRIADASLVIEAGKDGIHSENNDDASKGFIYIASGSVEAKAEGDGISAGAFLQLADGKIDLLVGGGAENGSSKSSVNYGGFMGSKPGGRPDEMQPGDTTSASAVTEEDSTSMKGMKATTGVFISGGNITINSADDSIHSDASITINDGKFTLASGDDAVHAEDTLSVLGGDIDISECYEGLEALHVEVKGGDIKLVASDDGLNAAGGTDQSGTEGGRDGMFGSPDGMGGGRPGGGGPGGGMSSNTNGSITISGGTLYINASGDGLDANGTLEISGGHVTVVGPKQGDTATLDYDKSGIITGGTFIGTGAAGGMAQSFSDSEQGVIAVNVGSQTAGTKIVLKDKEGNVIIEFSPELNFAVAILSSPDLVKGETYFIETGSESGEIIAN